MRHRERAGSQPLGRHYAVVGRRSVPENRARSATPLIHPRIERIGHASGQIDEAFIRTAPPSAAALHHPVIVHELAVDRHPPAIVNECKELIGSALWHGQPAAVMHQEEVMVAALSGRTTTPVGIDLWHDGIKARLTGRRLYPGLIVRILEAVVDGHPHALLWRVLCAHDGQEDERAEDDP